MQIGLLGPLEVAGADEAPVAVSGTRLRRLLTRLALDAGRPVSATELIDAVWPDDPPAESVNALQSLVSRLRRTLGDTSVVRQAGHGYLLAVSRDDVDIYRFTNLTRQARSMQARGDQAGAHATFGTALSLWRGQPLADAAAADYATGPAARLDEQRIDALSGRIDADLALGRAASVVGELDDLVQSHPMREQLTAQLMRALAASGRTAEALVAYDRLRMTLADALGTAPSPELQELHVALLRGEGPMAEQQDEPPARTNLPAGLTSFIGREPDRERVGDLLRRGRLVTVVGPGGAGKTRLATEVARDLVADVRDGVWFVPLAPVSSEADLAEAFLGALELREAHVIETRRRPPRDASSRLIEALDGRDTVLVVDNCEHLLDGVAGLVDQLLRTSPGVRIISTSLEPLNIDGEAVTTLAPLGVPPENATSAEAARYAAAQLFMDRAGSMRGDLTLDDSTVADVVEIVRRLDGMPLAIELAAARARVLPVGEIARRLSDRFRLLTGGSRTALPRHQTLRAVVDWSWDLLSDEERLVAGRLAVFPSGATAESAAAVCGDERVDDVTVVDLLDALADKSILVAPEAEPSAGPDDGGVRYRMLETIREYCLERLADTGQAEAVRRRHADWFAALVALTEPQLRTRDQLSALRRLEAERDNILAAIRYLIDIRDGATAIRVVVNLMGYWVLVGSSDDATTWLQAVLEQSSDTETDPVLRVLAEAGLALSVFTDESGAAPVIDPDEWRARVVDLSDRLQAVADVLPPLGVMMQAVLGLFSGDSKRADVAVAAGLASPDPWCRAAVRMVRANVAENAGDLGTLRSDVEIALREFREIGDRWGLASVLTSLGYVRTIDGDLDGALDAYTEAAGALGAIGARQDEMLIDFRLADLYLRTGRYDRARAAIQELGRACVPSIGQVLATALAARLAVLVGETGEVGRLRSRLEALAATVAVPTPLLGHGQAIALTALASLQLEQGDQATAAATLRDAYRVAVGTTDLPILAGTGTVVAALAAARDEPELAAEVLGATARLRGAEDPTDLFIARLTAQLREALGDGFAAAYDRGWQFTSEEAVTRLDPARVAESSEFT